MSIKIFILCVFIVMPGLINAQSPEQVFVKANELYQQGKFSEARDGYERVVQNGYESAELYYNLGNTYYKMGNIANAMVNYERAARLSPGDEDLQHNIQIVNLLLKDKIETTPRLFIWDYWERLKGLYSLSTLTWVLYGAYVMVLLAIGLLLLTHSIFLRRLAVVGGVVCMIGLFLTLAVFSARLSILNSRDTAIITAELVSIKNSPDPKSTDAFVLHSGVKVRITDGVNEWVKIRLADGKVGWMERQALEVI